MHAHAERHVRYRLFPGHIERSRIGKFGFIAVGGSVTHENHGSFWYYGAGKLHIARSLPGETLHRAFESQRLLDEVVQQARIPANLVGLIRIANDHPHTMRERAGCGLVATRYQLVHQALQFVHGQRRFAIRVGMHQAGDDVFSWFGATLVKHLRQIVLSLDFGLRRCAHFLRRKHARGRREHGVRPAFEAMQITRVEADLLGDDRAGKRQRKLVDVFAPPAVYEFVDQLVAQRIDRRRQILHPLAGKHLVEQLTIARVCRRIGALQSRGVGPTLLGDYFLVQIRPFTL